jgi:putative transposase
MIALAEQASSEMPVAPLCEALDVPRSSLYRHRKPKPTREQAPHPTPPRALSETERRQVKETLNTPRFVDKAPAEVYATLLDEGRYYCSIRTMYRLLAEDGQVQERRNQLRHPRYVRPELCASAPNQVWSWDITKLLGPAKWTHYCLYVVLDLFSRYTVGWMVAPRESAALAERLIRESCQKQAISPDQLVIHSDRGAAMTAKSVARLLADLGVTKSHSRPHVSDDNAYSEAQFRTLKYRPDFPTRFDSIDHARAFCREFFGWYNDQHRHWGIGLLTPQTVHYGLADDVIRTRQHVLTEAYDAHPERFVRGAPTPPELPEEVWINRPNSTTTTTRFDTKLRPRLSQNR